MGTHIFPYQFKITQQDRNRLNGHRSMLVWFTGLSGSGKSTIADALEQKLHGEGIRTMVLDGDNVRSGLCKELNFSQKDRSENVRRISEIARLLLESGAVVLASFISPYKKDREYVEKTINPNIFVEVFVNTSIGICENRDQKGLYKKARRGELDNLTGVSSPYEAPEAPDVEITENDSVQEAVEKVYKKIKDKLK
ncbi:adenylyl-sulfate kinase [Galbibacter sp. EGI 63066]|uniref:adenylyl-sulfate kinase n=1 Tax=Galbibacter sp. EGI 63066 TaxID=2993559 RepID=UPI0022487A4F|nr:adenylyl-sulfate kinase [Galbibacter sp. EGI 63066]MCX2680690.1 adenylyl-sulfate kinase [Galbibacter sp. EGI 63066]